MKYVCLVYLAEDTWNSVPDAECIAFAAGLTERGQRVAAEALEAVETATTVRLRDGRISVTDGPFSETKEHLAGFYLIDVADLDEAIRVASKIPPATVGSIEVRPIRELNSKQSRRTQSDLLIEQ